jgi:hypothetical protein
MPTVHPESEIWVPKSLEEIELVRRELDSILETDRFKNSRRFPQLFRYLVEETLAGRGETLKERSIGIAVFGSAADYDTAENPIVRVTVAEIRKRIAQYYQEEGQNSRIQIDLRPGHYMPRFYRERETAKADGEIAAQEGHSPLEAQAPLVLAPSGVVEPVRLGRHRWSFRFLALCALLLAGLALAALGYEYWSWSHSSALSEFWNPLLADRRTVVICMPMGNNNGGQTAEAAGILEPESGTPAAQSDAQPSKPNANPHTSSFQTHEIMGEAIIFSDTVAVLRISNYLATHRRDSYLRLAPATTLEDLRSGPVVLIGGIDNPWTLHALAPLPYRFSGTRQESYWISDRNHPGKKDWGLDIKQQFSAVKRDYAIIARIYDESTGQIEVIVAGIGMSGTAMGGQFVVDAQQMELLRHRIGPAFRDHNFEVILSTDVVNGSTGSPRIEAVSVW